ncbi:trifunctional dihydropteroate synthetase [Boothiomyces macroporosus]|uniref:Folic acid synthesis protein FOL1 n=1 Tax=Boothiomyces macroporosus TaxID=261099 RepID=A0AAD5UHI3_9FUNG|nr:trifunctional dihydropteroate synthetase [Boothiomyces macroporosus]
MANKIQKFVENDTSLKTLEALSAKIALDLLLMGLKKVTVKIEKCNALLHADTVGIEITRSVNDIEFLKPSNSVYIEYPDPTAEDVIFIKDLTLSCIIGIHPHERIEKQRVLINISAHFKPEQANPNQSPDRNNYKTIARQVSEFVENSKYETLETMVIAICDVVLAQCNVDKVTVKVQKPSALMFALAGVEITKSKKVVGKKDEVIINIAYLAVGTNLGDRHGNIQRAISELKARNIKVTDTSFLYETAPMYVEDQPKFLNAALKLKEIEGKLGRDFSAVRNGPRPIDLDILFFNHIEYKTDSLVIPHPRIQERLFVLEPLADIAENFYHPVLYRTVGRLLELARYKNSSKDSIYKVVPVGNAAWNLSKRTFIMGILNVTPDSFSDGGKYNTLDAAVANTLKMAAEGADIIDIGGQSTAPNVEEIETAAEIERVVPVIKAIREKNKDIAISVDTFRAEVAKAAVEAGANLINDISGGMRDPNMLKVMSECHVPVCLMHMRGDSKTMDSLTKYEGSLVPVIATELSRCTEQALEAGVCRWNIVVDPGVGFAKNTEQNFEIIKNLRQLTLSEPKLSGMPILVGLSRKRFIGTATGQTKPADRVWGTAAANTAAIIAGASIIRVHDVKEMKDVALVADGCLHK